MASQPLSEQRARTVTRQLLSFRGWDLRPVSSGGQLLEEAEYRSYGPLIEIFNKKSKTGPGYGKPDFLLVDSPESLRPLIVIDTKPRVADIAESIKDTHHYADAIHEAGKESLAVAVAGAEKEVCEVRVQRKIGSHWRDLTLHKHAIDWIPSPKQTGSILATRDRTEVSPERPPDKVLVAQANLLNEILRECDIKDEYRPVYAATFMLALWFGDVRTDPQVVLEQVNANAKLAMQSAHKPDLADGLRVNGSNKKLAKRAWEIIDILKKLNIRSFLQEHDYLGQLYETFFRYTGGNTIGQYFTPRHIVNFMADLTAISSRDIVFDPACGTGGFLIGALNRMIRMEGLNYEEAIKKVRHNIYGLESEPTTAALCVANMILRGDGKSGVVRADCFEKRNFPPKPADVALLNPPFPHRKKRQKPASAFITRALASVKNKGHVAAVVPYSLLANVKEWHQQILKHNRLLFVGTMPADLFTPYSNYDTAVLMLQKGVSHGGARVFFCRIDDDGYKLKKGMRVPHGRGTSQLAAVIEAFDKKTEIPEFSAYQPVTSDTSEWSPETFIEGAPHNDAEFVAGFEESMRRHAAFYVRFGHRLLGPNASVGLPPVERAFARESRVALAGTRFGRFRVSDYLDVTMGGRDEIEDLEEGDDPFISTSEWNNGLTEWKKANRLFSSPSITVATDGSAYASFVQEFPFYAFYKVAILRPKNRKQITADALYYLAYLLNREEWRFVRARKFGKARIEATELYGPVTKGGTPDFARMAELTRQSSTFPVIASFREAYEGVAADRFARLSREWKLDGRPLSSAVRMAAHPAYQQIVRMGETAVPHILAELEREPDHWFIALNRITGANPVPEESRGKIDRMAEAWIQWGRERGYEW